MPAGITAIHANGTHFLRRHAFGTTRQLRIVGSAVTMTDVTVIGAEVAEVDRPRIEDKENVIARLARGNVVAARAAERQGFFGAGLLDFLPDAYGIYGFMRLVADYDGPLIRVRSTLTAGEHDVYPDDNGRASLGTIVGGSLACNENYRVATLYDQSGNGRHATAPSFAQMPQFSSRQGDGLVARISASTRLLIPGSAAFTEDLRGATIATLLYPGPAAAIPLHALRIGAGVANHRLAIRRTTGANLEALVTPSGGGQMLIPAPAPFEGWTATAVSANYAEGKGAIWQNGALKTFEMPAGNVGPAQQDISILNNAVSDTAITGHFGGAVILREALSPTMLSVLGEAMRSAAPNVNGDRLLLRIAYLTDMHCSPSKPTFNDRHFADAPAKIQAALAWFDSLLIKPDILVIGGDSIDGRGTAGDLEDAALVKDLMEAFKGRVPTVYVLGNHDLSSSLTKAQILAAFGSTRPPHGSLDLGGVHIVWLDANYYADDDDAGYDAPDASYTFQDTWLPPAQREWLDADLGATTLPTIIFCHQCLDDAGFHTVLNADAYQAIVRRHPHVLGTVVGHRHLDQRRLHDARPHYRVQANIVNPFSSGAAAAAVIDVYRNRLEIYGNAGQGDHNVIRPI